MKIYRLRLRSKLPTPADSNSDSDSDSAALLVTVGSLATHQILAQLVNRILRYGDGGRAHVQRYPTPSMTCGRHVLSDPNPHTKFEHNQSNRS